MSTLQLAPMLNRKSLENTYRYAGGTVSILLTGEDTGGYFSMWESVQKPGAEPPLHVHHDSDETFQILEGNMRFMIGDQIRDAGPGDVVFAPKGIPHSFRIKSPIAKAITICTPSGFEYWFKELGEPANNFELPEKVAPPSAADIPKMVALSQRLGTEIIRQVDF
jgi:mannose-6-phosphate isomerase-like protein (cupin superfamily)